MYGIDMVECPSSAADASGAFLERAFGWAPTAYGPDYVDVQGGGISLGFQSDVTERTNAPLVVIRAVTVDPSDFPGGRRFHFREPGGCELAVWRPALVNGAGGLVNAPGGEPYGVLSFTVINGRIVEIDILVDPERRGRLDPAGFDA